MAQTALIAVRETLEDDDIQGLVARGYKDLRSARFLLLRVTDAARARAYLRRLCDDGIITPIRRKPQAPKDHAMQIVFTHHGLEALGVPATAVASFPRELKEGMEGRAEVLGDFSDNDPARWEFGRTHEGAVPIDVMLMIYAKTETILHQRVAEETAAFAGGFALVIERESNWLADDKEHFGFRDGISMAAAEGLDDGRVDLDQGRRHFKNGEFVLGYRNEYGHYTDSPVVAASDDPHALLPGTRDGAARDLGKNGTYLVYRQLAQHVGAFWDYMKRESKEPSDDPSDAAIRLAAKMVGRWPEGASLVTHPDRHDEKTDDNAFGFWVEDPEGTRCPFGSHIRRTNPRDHLPVDHTQKDSKEMVGKHQILRRGRTFGKPLAPTMKTEEIIAARDDGETRGLHFICLVGHIHRQFEFMQNAWVKSANFAALDRDGDPLIGARHPAPHPNANDEFTCPADPVRRKYRAMPAFTRLLGGGYFFMPGLKALRYIATDRP